MNFFQIDKLEGFTQIKVLVKELDEEVALTLKSELILLMGNGEKNVSLDLSEINSYGSFDLSAIRLGDKLCNNVDGAFVLTRVQPNVKRFIMMSQLDDVLTIAEDIEEAMDIMLL